MRQRQHAAAIAAPKTRRPRGLAAAMGASDTRSNLPSSSNTQHTTPTLRSTSPDPALDSSSDTLAQAAAANTDTGSSCSGNDTSSSHINISRSAGLSQSDASSSSSSAIPGGNKASATALTMAELSCALQKKLGYSLEVRRSGDHAVVPCLMLRPLSLHMLRFKMGKVPLS